MVRGWRNWCSKRKSLKDCITANAYYSLELNAHALISFIVYCREKNAPEQFLISALSSQQCEHLFRFVRSMSTTKQTVVNCTIKEFTDRLKRITLQFEIMYRHRKDFNFPTIQRLEMRRRETYLPSDKEIKDSMDRAFSKACEELVIVGITGDLLLYASVGAKTPPIEQIFELEESIENDNHLEMEQYTQAELAEICPYQQHVNVPVPVSWNNGNEQSAPEIEFVSVEESSFENDELENDNVFAVQDVDNDGVCSVQDLFPNCVGSLQLKSTTTGSRHTFRVQDLNGRVKNIKKSTLLWMLLTQGRYHLSADRTRRFKQKEYRNKRVR